jgi:hypothetical protein
MYTASAEFTDEFLLLAIQSRSLAQCASKFPDPRLTTAMRMEVILAACLAAQFAGIYALCQLGYPHSIPQPAVSKAYSDITPDDLALSYPEARVRATRTARGH